MGMESSKRTCSQWDTESVMDCGKHRGLRNLVLSKPGTCWVILGKFLWVFFRISVLELILIGFSTSDFPCFWSKKPTPESIPVGLCVIVWSVCMNHAFEKLKSSIRARTDFCSHLYTQDPVRWVSGTHHSTNSCWKNKPDYWEFLTILHFKTLLSSLLRK